MLWFAVERRGVAIVLAAGLAWLPSWAWGTTAIGQEAHGLKANSSGLQQARKYRAAEKQYESLLKARPRSARLWSNLGAIRAMLGDCSAALPALERARSINKNLFAPWYYSGYCHLALHQNRLAMEDLRRANALNPKDANAWFLAAQAAAKLNHPGYSFQAAIHSLSLDSHRAGAYYLAGEDALSLTKREYARVVAKQPSVFAYRLRAERNLGQDLPAAATGDYRKALGLEPGAPDLLFGLGSAELAEGKFQDAERAFRRCLNLLPDTDWARLRLALALAAQSKSRQATALLSSVQPLKLESPHEWEDLIATAYFLRHPIVADHWLGEAESRFPGGPAWSHWSQRIAAEKAMPDAPPDVSFTFERSSSVALSVTFLLTTQMTAGNLITADFGNPGEFADFRTAFLRGDGLAAAVALESQPRNLPADPRAAFVTGDILHLLSLELLQRLTTRYPTSAPAMMLAAQNYSAVGDQAKAIEIYQALLQEHGPSTAALRGLAKVYYAQSDWDQALRALTRLAKMEPNDPTIFVNLGRIYTYQDKWREAGQSFATAARIGPRAYQAHLGLGEVLNHQGEEKRAITELTLAARLQPSRPRPHYLLAVIYRRLGKKQLAVKEMEEFERLQAHSSSESRHEGHR